jgi:hypothetical protein
MLPRPDLRHSRRGLVEETTCITISDIRHGLEYPGTDRDQYRIPDGPAAGLVIGIDWTRPQYGWHRTT